MPRYTLADDHYILLILWLKLGWLWFSVGGRFGSPIAVHYLDCRSLLRVLQGPAGRSIEPRNATTGEQGTGGRLSWAMVLGLAENAKGAQLILIASGSRTLTLAH